MVQVAPELRRVLDPGGAGGRNAGIDLVRGVAILMVLLLHFGLTYPIWHRGPLVRLVGPAWARSILDPGNFGVTMFFVVSGFLIATNAAERSGGLGRIDLRSFYVRRFARIVPSLLSALLIILALGLFGIRSFAAEGPAPTTRLLLGVLSVLGFFHNILMQRLGYFDYALNVYWSLSVEEVFYLAFPLVCLLLRRDRFIALPCLLFIAIGPFYRASHGHDDILYLYANLACFDAISIGCLASMLARRWRPSRRAASALRLLGWTTLVVFWLRGFDGPHKVFGFTIIALSTAAIVLGSVARRGAAPRVSRFGQVLRWLGRHSYELYLFHIIVLGLMRDLIPGPALGTIGQIPWLVVFLSLSAAIAACVARGIGEPANARLRGLASRPAARAPALDPAGPGAQTPFV